MELMNKTELAQKMGCSRINKERGLEINHYKFRKYIMTDETIKEVFDLDMSDTKDRKTYNKISTIEPKYLRKIKKLFPEFFAAIFCLFFISSCDITATEDMKADIFPTEVPADPYNPITDGKHHLGQLLFSEDMGKAVSLSGKINCASCHTEATGGGSPDMRFPGGVGEGATLVTTPEGMRYKLWEDYHGIKDSMVWVNSVSYANLAFQKKGGLSTRFGQGLSYDEFIAHFKPKHITIEQFHKQIPESFVRDTLLQCEVGAMQAFMAYMGHNQFSVKRIEQRLDILDSINLYMATDFTPMDLLTRPYQISWAMACAVDVHQRNKGYRNNTRSQQLLRGDEDWTMDEYNGYKLMKSYCTSAEINGIDYSCHHKIDWSGEIAPSGYKNLPGVPDAVNDLTDRIPDTSLVYRKVRTIYYEEDRLWDPHGRTRTIDDFLYEHTRQYYNLGITRMKELGPAERKAIIAYIVTL